MHGTRGTTPAALRAGLPRRRPEAPATRVVKNGDCYSDAADRDCTWSLGKKSLTIRELTSSASWPSHEMRKQVGIGVLSTSRNCSHSVGSTMPWAR